MVRVLRDDHMCQQTRSCQAALDRTRWRRRFDHSIAACAGELRPHMADDLEALRNILELFRDVVPEMAKAATAIRTAIALGPVHDLFAFKMFRQRLALGTRLRFLTRRDPFSDRFGLRLRSLVLFQLKLHLLELENQLLALLAEDHVTELLDHQLEVLDALSARVEFFGLLGHRLAMRIQLCLEPPNLFVLSSDQRCELLLMRTNQIEQRLPIECIQIRKRRVIHGRSMPLLHESATVENPHRAPW